MTLAPVITRLHPVAIAHRAANNLATLREAERERVDLLECDIWPYRGRLEVRHEKTLGNTPVPLLWDREGWRRWQLRRGWRPRLGLADLLEARAPDTELMLDLKGADVGLPGAILEVMERVGTPPRFTVCSQNWSLLTAFLGRTDAAVVHSVGNSRQLARLRTTPGVTAVSIHSRLLSPAVMSDLHERGCFVMTWSVETWDWAQTLLAMGVDGIISSKLDVLRRVMATRT